jgi:hypothetical protein
MTCCVLVMSNQVVAGLAAQLLSQSGQQLRGLGTAHRQPGLMALGQG